MTPDRRSRLDTARSPRSGRPRRAGAWLPLASLAALAVAASGGCGDDDGASPADPGAARFAAASAEERAVAVALAAGEPIALAAATLLLAELEASFTGCPARTVEAGAVVYEAGSGCQTPDGTTWEGHARVANASFLVDGGDPATAHDPSRPTTIALTALRRGTAAGAIHLDGTIEIAAPDAAGAVRTEASLALEADVRARVDLVTVCAPDAGASRCRYEDGSRAELAGVGSFAIRGALTATDDPPDQDGWLELQGVDTLRAELQAGRACDPYAIDAEPAGVICRDAAPVEPELEITGGSVGCGGPTLDIEAFVAGPAVMAHVEIATASRSETHELVKLGDDETTGEAVWGLNLVLGVDTGFTCADLERAGVRVTAMDAAGGEACRVLGEGSESPFGSDC